MTYKELKNKIKEEQKELAHKIRLCKPLRKPSIKAEASQETRSLCRYNEYSWEYRHRHIVYCQLFNNTPYEKIESKVGDDNAPSQVMLDKLTIEWKAKIDEIVRDCA